MTISKTAMQKAPLVLVLVPGITGVFPVIRLSGIRNADGFRVNNYHNGPYLDYNDLSLMSPSGEDDEFEVSSHSHNESSKQLYQPSNKNISRLRETSNESGPADVFQKRPSIRQELEQSGHSVFDDDRSVTPSHQSFS